MRWQEMPKEGFAGWSRAILPRAVFGSSLAPASTVFVMVAFSEGGRAFVSESGQ